jgi:hypothetical protein
MKSFFLFLSATVLIVGCASPKTPQSVTVDTEFVKRADYKLVMSVTNALESSPTYKDLKRHAKRVMIIIGEEDNGWITVEIGSDNGDFFHRWATLKIEEKSGKIMRLGTDEKLEYKWFDDRRSDRRGKDRERQGVGS